MSLDFLLTSLIVVSPGTGVLFRLAASLERIPLSSRDAPAVPRR
jgi:hypothetical protein